MTPDDREAAVKICRDCMESLPINMFGPERASKDGKKYSCRKCLTAKQLKRFYAADGGKSRRLNRRARYRQQVVDGTVRLRKSTRSNVRPYDAHEQAMRRVKSALRRGDVIKPLKCSCCGSARNLEAHHPDYSKPLEVEWLCSLCHSETRFKD
jgi:hypothetical protein